MIRIAFKKERRRPWGLGFSKLKKHISTLIFEILFFNIILNFRARFAQVFGWLFLLNKSINSSKFRPLWKGGGRVHEIYEEIDNFFTEDVGNR